MVAIAALGLGVWFGFGQNSDRDDSIEIDISEFLTETYPDTRGESVVVAEAMGAKLTLINFWATWCAPCRHEMPVFETFYQQYQAQGFAIMGLTLDDPEPAETFLQSVGVTYPALIMGDAGWSLLSRFGNNQGLLPYSILVDQQGLVLERKLGEIDAGLLSTWLKKHLN